MITFRQFLSEMSVRDISGKMISIKKVVSRNVSGKLQKTYPGKSASSGGGGGSGSDS